MSLTIKAATTMPVKIEIDVETNAGRIKGHFTGHARIRSKPQMKLFAEQLAAMTTAEPAPESPDETLLREMYTGFDGLANESGPLEGDAAFQEILTGPLSMTLTRTAQDEYWKAMAGTKAREGNERPVRVR